MSGSAPHAVDLDQLDHTVEVLAACHADFGDALDDITRQVARLHLTWAGAAAEAQAEAQLQWETGFAAMREGLETMRRVGRTAHGNYRAAIEANLAMWGSL